MFSGLTATDPAGLTLFVDDVATDILTYLRDPGLIEPLLADVQELAGRRSSIRYFFDAFRLRAPSLALDVVASPLVAAPAHHMPIDYFSGPTRCNRHDERASGGGIRLPRAHPAAVLAPPTRRCSARLRVAPASRRRP